MIERRTLRQISASLLDPRAASAPPPAIDDADAKAQRERGRAFLREAAAIARRIEGEEKTHG